jgi:hypothetical protein
MDACLLMSLVRLYINVFNIEFMKKGCMLVLMGSSGQRLIKCSLQAPILKAKHLAFVKQSQGLTPPVHQN